MADKKQYQYQVRQANEKKPFEWSGKDGSDAMVEINGCGVIIAFFVVVCASGFALWLLRHARNDVGAVAFVFSIVLGVVLLGIVGGMAWSTLRQFREQQRMEAVVLTAISFAAAIVIGVAIGLSLPTTFTVM